MLSTNYTLPKENKLLTRKDFLNLRNDANKIITSKLIVYLKKNGLSVSRIGISISKKTGHAVLRNRMKRKIREYFRKSSDLKYGCHDMIFVVKAKKIQKNTKIELKSCFEQITKKIAEMNLI